MVHTKYDYEYTTDEINAFIKLNHSQNTQDMLSDENIQEECLLSKKHIEKKNIRLEQISSNKILSSCSKEHMDEFIRIINSHLIEDIAPGIKGNIRGKNFNFIVEEIICNIIKLQSPEYRINIEKKLDDISSHTSEIPDFTIENIITGKKLIGMNQVDLWDGGAQLNRGKKYLLDDKFLHHKYIKQINVICNYTKVTNRDSIRKKIFAKGIKEKNLCYITNLEELILDYFNLL